MEQWREPVCLSRNADAARRKSSRDAPAASFSVFDQFSKRHHELFRTEQDTKNFPTNNSLYKQSYRLLYHVTYNIIILFRTSQPIKISFAFCEFLYKC